jgi:hypothetical protein
MIGQIVCGALIVIAAENLASASEQRSRTVTREFQREHPCPSTGRASGPCPGLSERSHCAACLRRARCGFQSTMADDRRCEG